MPSRNTYHLTWVSLTLDLGYLFTAAPAKVQVLLLTLGEGYLLTAAAPLPDLERGIAPLGPLVPAQLPLLGLGAAPPAATPGLSGGRSSRLLLHRRSLALSAAAPDLRRGVGPLSCSP